VENFSLSSTTPVVTGSIFKLDVQVFLFAERAVFV